LIKKVPFEILEVNVLPFCKRNTTIIIAISLRASSPNDGA